MSKELQICLNEHLQENISVPKKHESRTKITASMVCSAIAGHATNVYT